VSPAGRRVPWRGRAQHRRCEVVDLRSRSGCTVQSQRSAIVRGRSRRTSCNRPGTRTRCRLALTVAGPSLPRAPSTKFDVVGRSSERRLMLYANDNSIYLLIRSIQRVKWGPDAVTNSTTTFTVTTTTVFFGSSFMNHSSFTAHSCSCGCS